METDERVAKVEHRFGLAACNELSSYDANTGVFFLFIQLFYCVKFQNLILAFAFFTSTDSKDEGYSWFSVKAVFLLVISHKVFSEMPEK